MGQKTLKCLRCESEMYLLEHEGFLLGDKHFLARGGYMFTGRLEADIFVCPQCGKIELFSTKSISDFSDEDQNKDTDLNSAESDEIVAKKCGVCGSIASVYSNTCAVCGETEMFIPQVKCPCCGRLHDFDDPKCPGCGMVQQQPPTILNSI